MVFDEQWFKTHQRSLLWFANTRIGRWFFRINGNASSVGDNRIVGILPNAIFWKGKKRQQYHAEFRTHDKFAKRLYYGLKPIWSLLHLWDTIWANRVQPSWNVGFDTLTVYPAAGANSPVDGRVYRGAVDETFGTIIAGAGSTAVATDAAEWHVLVF